MNRIGSVINKAGIHVRILVAAFVLIGATTLSLSYLGAQFAHRFAQERFEEQIAFLAKYLALNAELGILIDDRAMLRSLAANLLSEDIAAVAILDGQGRELVRVPQGAPGPRYTAVREQKVILTASRDESEAFRPSGPPAEAASQAAAGGAIGTVRLFYSTAGLDRLWRGMTASFTALAAGLTALAGLVFYFLSRSLVAPVKALAEAARRVADGERSLRAAVGTLPETRELAVAFNFMLDSLERSRRSLEEAREQVRRQKTLAEMGKFALMIAHEFKNPLGIIKGSLDLLKKDHGLADDTMVRYIDDEVRRLNRLIGDFMAFSRPVTPTFRREDLNALLREVAARSEMQFSAEGVVIRAEIPATPCFAEADGDLLSRALANVVKNAVEAALEARAGRRGGVEAAGKGGAAAAEDETGAGGEMTQEEVLSGEARDKGGRAAGASEPLAGVQEEASAGAAREDVADGLAWSGGAQAGQADVEIRAARTAAAWRVEIADRGQGIPAENLEKIFTPFFTTRAKGAGLGLAYAAQAVKAHGGQIRAENRPEGGALFTIDLPV